MAILASSIDITPDGTAIRRHPAAVVKGAVDSENSFGALIRNNYTCTVTYKGKDNWRLVELTGLNH